MIATTTKRWRSFERAWIAAMRSPSLQNHHRAMRAALALQQMGYSLTRIQNRGRRAFFLAEQRRRRSAND